MIINESMASKRTRPIEERFQENTTTIPETSCIWWIGGLYANGYGSFYVDGKARKAHRVAYEMAYGAIPDLTEGKRTVVRHTCDNPLCVNPDHLRLGAQADNMQDMRQRGRHWMAKRTHCKNGHPFSGDNVRPNSGGGRACRACLDIANKKRRAKQRKARAAAITAHREKGDE